MKNQSKLFKSFLCTFGLFASLMSASSSATTVFESAAYQQALASGFPNVNGWCSTCSGTFAVFDRFNLSQATHMNSVDFAYTTWYGGNGNGSGQNFSINIWSGDGSSMLFSQAVSASDYTFNNLISGVSIAHALFNGLTLNPGQYLISWNGNFLAIPGYNDPLGSLYQSDSPNSSVPYLLHNGQSAAFQLNGVIATPIPAPIWLFGSGLMGLLGFKRKQQTA